MPIDVFAALGALVRAEAARTAARPTYAAPPTYTRTDSPSSASEPGPAIGRTGPPPHTPTTAAAPAAAVRKRPLAKMYQKLAALFGY